MTAPTVEAYKGTTGQGQFNLTYNSTTDGINTSHVADGLSILVVHLHANLSNSGDGVVINGTDVTSLCISPPGGPGFDDGQRQVSVWAILLKPSYFDGSNDMQVAIRNMDTTNLSRITTFIAYHPNGWPKVAADLFYEVIVNQSQVAGVPQLVGHLVDTGVPRISFDAFFHASTGGAQNLVETYCDIQMSSVSVSGTTVTVTCTTAHGFAVGNTVHIHENTGTNINGAKTVVAASVSGDNTKFTYTQSGAVAGTGGVCGKLGTDPQLNNTVLDQANGNCQAGFKVYDSGDYGSALSHNVDATTAKVEVFYTLQAYVPQTRHISGKTSTAANAKGLIYKRGTARGNLGAASSIKGQLKVAHVIHAKSSTVSAIGGTLRIIRSIPSNKISAASGIKATRMKAVHKVHAKSSTASGMKGTLHRIAGSETTYDLVLGLTLA